MVAANSPVLYAPAAGVSGRTTITRDDGTFVFEGLPTGQYALAAVKSGYIGLQYGATGPGRLIGSMPAVLKCWAGFSLTEVSLAA